MIDNNYHKERYKIITILLLVAIIINLIVGGFLPLPLSVILGISTGLLGVAFGMSLALFHFMHKYIGEEQDGQE